MSHDRKHYINSNSDHLGIPNANENNILAIDTNGFPKDSGLTINDSGNSILELITANQVNERLYNQAISILQKQSALGFYFSQMT